MATKFGMMMHFEPFDRFYPSNFHILKSNMAAAAILKNRKEIAVLISNGLTNYREIWHGDAFLPS